MATADDDMGGIANPSGGVAGTMVGVEVNTATAAVDIAYIFITPRKVGALAAANSATLYLDEGAVEHVAVLAAAEDTSAHHSVAADGDISGIDEVEVVVFVARHTAGGTEDTAVVTAIGADASTANLNHSLAGTRVAGQYIHAGTASIVTHRSHRAAAIDGVVDQTTRDFDRSIAKDTSSITTEEVCRRAVVDTAATGIDIAEEGVVTVGDATPVVGEGIHIVVARIVADAIDGSVDGHSCEFCRGIFVGRLAAYHAGTHADISVLRDMAVGTATEDRTADVGLDVEGVDSGVDLLDGVGLDGDLGVVDIGHVVVFGVRGIACQTAAGAKDRAFVMASATDATTGDNHFSQTSTGNGVTDLVGTGAVGRAEGVEVILSADDVAHDVISCGATDIIDGVAHGSQRATAEDIVVDDAA